MNYNRHNNKILGASMKFIFLVTLYMSFSTSWADSPAPRNSFTEKTKNGKFIFFMNEDYVENKKRSSGLYKLDALGNIDGESIWSVDWYGRLSYLSPSGQYIIRYGGWPTHLGQRAFGFYNNGKLTKEYIISDLLVDPTKRQSSVSHFEYILKQKINHKSMTLDLNLYDGSSYKIDIKTGEILKSTYKGEKILSTGKGFFYSYKGDQKVAVIHKGKSLTVDIKTFKVLGDAHIMGKRFIYDYLEKGTYAKDKKSVFFNGNKLKNADAKSFAINKKFPYLNYAYDKNYVYLYGEKAHPVFHGETFIIIDKKYSKDKNFVYKNGKKIPGLHGASFKFLKNIGQYRYCKDKFAVYYQQSRENDWPKPLGTEKWKKLLGADGKSFHHYHENYYKDNKGVFQNGKTIIKGPSAKSFKLNKGVEYERSDQYTKKKGNVFFNGMIVRSIDANSFRKNHIKQIYFDKKGPIVNTMRVKGVHFETFKFVGGGFYKDKNSVYFLSKKFHGADPDSFEKLGTNFSKDKNHVFYKRGIVKGADPKFFKSISYHYGRDNKHVYYMLNKLKNAHAASFKEVDIGYKRIVMQDKDNLYHNGFTLPGSVKKNLIMLRKRNKTNPLLQFQQN